MLTRASIVSGLEPIERVTRQMNRFVIPLITLCCLAVPVMAQAERATLSGTVTDSSGGAMSGVHVELTDMATGFHRDASLYGKFHELLQFRHPARALVDGGDAQIQTRSFGAARQIQN